MATRGDIPMATREDFFMATDIWMRTSSSDIGVDAALDSIRGFREWNADWTIGDATRHFE